MSKSLTKNIVQNCDLYGEIDLLFLLMSQSLASWYIEKWAAFILISFNQFQGSKTFRKSLDHNLQIICDGRGARFDVRGFEFVFFDKLVNCSQFKLFLKYIPKLSTNNCFENSLVEIKYSTNNQLWNSIRNFLSFLIGWL